MKRNLALSILLLAVSATSWGFTKTNWIATTEAGYAVSNGESWLSLPFTVCYADKIPQRGYVWFPAIPTAIQEGVVSQAVLVLNINNVVTNLPVQVNAYTLGSLTYTTFTNLPQEARFAALTGTLESAGVTAAGDMAFSVDAKRLNKKSQMGFAIRLLPENRTALYSFTSPRLKVIYTPYYAITLGANPPEGGTVTGSGSVAGGSSRTVKAYANNGYTFSNWTEGASVVSTNWSYTFTVTKARALTANFSKNPSSYAIALSANPPEGGTVSGAGTFAAESTQTVYAAAAAGYAFTNWTEGASVVGLATNFTFILDRNRDLVAHFTPTQSAGVIHFKVSRQTVAETVGSVVVRVIRSGGSFGPASVHYKTIAGTALVDEDFRSRSGTLNWLAGQKGTQFIVIPIIADGRMEPEETFRVKLSAVTGAALGTPAKDTIAIASQFPPAPGDAPVDEQEPGAAFCRFGELVLAGPGSLSFQWRLDTANPADAFLLMDNGAVSAALRGPSAWQPGAMSLTNGLHLIRWVYVGDPAGSPGSGAVDQVEWAPEE